MPFWSTKSKSKSKSKKSSVAESSTPTSPSHAGSDPWGSHPSSAQHHFANTLRGQYATLCPQQPAVKIRLSMLSAAMVDALGGPAEFKPRFSFPWINSMIPNHNFNLPAGVWTDDTSMMLCLAHSISTYKDVRRQDGSVGGFDELAQLEEYRAWYEEGRYSAVGKCFDIGNTTKKALQIFSRYPGEEGLLRIRSDLATEDTNSGNGSLMRVLPIGLVYWRDDEQLKTYGRRSSQATHPSSICTEACEMWVQVIGKIMEATVDRPEGEEEDEEFDPENRFSKLTLLEYISNFPFNCNQLREMLCMPFGVPPRPATLSEKEKWYWKYHPLLRLITDTQANAVQAKESKFPYAMPSEDALPSSGYTVHTITSALYCFFSTKTFEDGALMAVNLGNDADTVGAIYAGLAGCWYGGVEGGDAEQVFWTKRVQEWRKGLVAREMIEQVTEEVVLWETRVADGAL